MTSSFHFLEKLENHQKYRDIKLVTTEKRRNYLVSERKCLVQR